MDLSSNGSSASSAPPPDIPDYRLVRCIGGGSYGNVWLAAGMAQTYRAIKVVYRDRFDDARPYERELAGLRNFDPISRANDGLIDVLHVGQRDGYFYYVMELGDDVLTGQNIAPDTYTPRTLTRVLAQRSRLPFSEALELGMTLSKALSYLHQRSLVHRDVKPSNIIFVNGLPKLADIGLVADMKDPKSFVGTEGYIPPEGAGMPQADIYSLGKVLYEVSTGQDRKDFPRLPSDIDQWPNPDQFRELNEVLLKACQSDPRQRYQTADDMYADLGCLLNGRSVRRLRVLERRWAELKRATLVGAAVLGLVGIGGYEFIRENGRRHEDRAREAGGQVARGIERMESGELIQALPSFVRGLALGDAQKDRIRIRSLLDQSAKLLQIWFNAGETTDGQFSPDGRLVAIATREQKIHIKDAVAGTDLVKPFGPDHQIETVCFSPDGLRVLIGSQDKTASVWDWKAGTNCFSLPHPAPVLTARFSHNGARIVTACGDGVGRVWDASTGVLLVTLRGHLAGLRDAAFNAADDLIVTSGKDNLAIVWRASDGTLQHKLQHASWVFHANFSPDGTRLATACFDRQAHIWDWHEEREVMPGLRHKDGVSSVQFSPDGRLLLTGCWDMSARLWVASSGRPLNPNPVLPHSGRVLRAAFAPDGHRIITSSFDGTSRIWDLAGSALMPEVIKATLSENGARLLVRNNASLRVLDAKTRREFPPISVKEQILEATLNLNGRFVMAVCRTRDRDSRLPAERILLIWNSESGEALGMVSGFSNSLSRVRLSDSGDIGVTWVDKTAQIFRVSSEGGAAFSFAASRTITNALFAPSGRDLLILSGTEGRMFDVATWRCRFVLPHRSAVKSATFSADGKLLVTSCSDELFTECAAQVWNAATGDPVGGPIKHKDGVLNANFSPDGRKVVSASEDFTALISEVAGTGSPKRLAHTDQLRMASFSPGGGCVLTVTRNQLARVWDERSGEPLTPPLPHFATIWRGAFVDDSTVSVTDQEGTCWVWRLEPIGYSLEEMTTLARVLNGDMTDPSRTARTSYDDILDRWQRLKARYPEASTVSDHQRVNWHKQQLHAAEDERNATAASFHLEQLRQCETVP